MANSSTRTLRLFVVRHGERKDEALDRAFWEQKKERPRCNRLDPRLTKTGHLQALESFTVLLSILVQDENAKKPRIAIFTSPMRRCIGTAMMVGAAAAKANTEQTIEWVMPLECDGRNEDSIPIVIVNRLGDFAANVSHHGGTDNLAPILPCAAKHNDNACSAAVADMHCRASKVVHTGALTEAEIPKRQSIQFFHFHESSHTLTRATANNVNLATSPALTLTKQPSSRPGERRGLSRPACTSIDLAIQMAFAQECDTCIIVAHRETIYEMAIACGIDRFRASYCCIGSFTAEMKANGSLGYQCHGIFPYESFTRSSIPS